MKTFYKKISRLNPLFVSVLIVVLLTIPSFYRMLFAGIYSMQDFPYFRLIEYSKCFTHTSFPCRWAPDAGLGYGEPVFNFYSHVPFFVGSILMFLGYSGIDSLKILFAFSLLGSGLSMYFLSKHVWRSNFGAIVSAVLYVYAPYRAVDVWVRGALPESFAFVFLPLILFCFEKYCDSRRRKWLIAFSASFALLITTHNLSVILLAPIIGLWIIFRLLQFKALTRIPSVAVAVILSALLSAFYLLPAIGESSLVNLQTTTQGYFDFRAHFVTLPQLFISRFWGYGASTWGAEDGLSLSLGQAQIAFSVITLLLAFFKILKTKKLNLQTLFPFYLLGIAVLYLFLTHNQSGPIWEALSFGMKYIQFPWRFLAPALFCISVATGSVFVTFKKGKEILFTFIVFVTIFLNVNFFKEDIWYNTTDQALQTGQTWIDQSRASIGDYWPTYGPIPTKHRSEEFPDLKAIQKGSATQYFDVNLKTEEVVSFPIAYFPNWVGYDGVSKLTITPDKDGFVSTKLSKGDHRVTFVFTDTLLRTVGNTISAVTLCALLFGTFLKRDKHE